MKKLLFILGGMIMLAGSTGMVFAAETYAIDKAHSSIGFGITHMMVAKTTGVFDDFDGTLQFDPNDLANSSLNITIKAASINTRHDQRDGHLRGADFFDVEKAPLITFTTKKIVLKEGSVYTFIGDLTMKGVTKEVEWPVTVAGPVKNPMTSGQNIGLLSEFTLNRQDYGINWNKAMDNGGVLIGNDVKVSVSIEATK